MNLQRRSLLHTESYEELLLNALKVDMQNKDLRSARLVTLFKKYMWSAPAKQIMILRMGNQKNEVWTSFCFSTFIILNMIVQNSYLSRFIWPSNNHIDLIHLKKVEIWKRFKALSGLTQCLTANKLNLIVE